MTSAIERRPTLRGCIAVALLLAALASKSIAAPPRLLLADGTASEADLTEPTPDGKLAFASAGKRIAPEARDLVRWGAFVTPGSGASAVLDRGDVLMFTACAVEGEEVKMQTAAFGEVRVPIAALRGLVYQPPGDVQERDRLFDELTQPAAKENSAPIASGLRVTLDNGDIVDGKLASLSTEKLVLDAATGKLTLGVDRVRVLAFAPPATPTKTPRSIRFVIGTTDGSRVTATDLALTAEGLQLTMPAGTKWNLLRDKVAAIQILGGKATYLSDLAASGYKHVPYLATTWPLATDRNVIGGRLRAGGSEFLKGLGMHSAASATYALDKPYRRFEAVLAIDDSAQDRGSVLFRVYIDTGDGVWKLRHTSANIRGGDAPTPVAIDLAGAKRLSLIVDFADRADEGDRANWLDARLIE